MSFWDRFRKKPRELQQEQEQEQESTLSSDWSRIVYTRKDLNIHDAMQRREYIQNCLVQMAEGNRELDNLQFEYRAVTSYLHDMEEIDALTAEKHEQLEACARKIADHEEQREQFKRRKNRMSDQEYERMDQMGDSQIQENICKMVDTEDYQKKIRNDLKRLDAEHQAYDYREKEAEKMLDTCRSMSVMCGIMLVMVLIVLFVLHELLHLEVIYGYMAVILVAAIAIVLLYVRSSNAQAEQRTIRNTIARLVLLQNTVKIRYVNNRNLLDYLYLKCGVQSADQLSAMAQRYAAEKEERERFQEAEKFLDSDQQDLLFLLRNLRIKTPDIWLHQTAAILDSKEAVEIRHNLIVQRQSLRKRIDYNREVVIGNAKAEVEDLAHSYPEYAAEILDQVSRYQAENGMD
ncbi:MAG: hypothetical protein KA965_04360 [Butyrivibrio sp.]|nr:hypothetical protein [Butyrivibrio sp.]